MMPLRMLIGYLTGLKEATLQSLLRERYRDANLRERLLAAPLYGRRDAASKFGDVVVLARGQLYAVRGGALAFVQDPHRNDDCDDCYNARRCDKHQCQPLTQQNQERLLALWTVKRLRHRDFDGNSRYEIEYTVSPINDITRDIVVRKGRFNYAIPGHVFVIKSGEADKNANKEYEQEIYNRKIPQNHYIPNIPIGYDSTGHRKVLHSYPGFFTSGAVLPPQRTTPKTTDPKEIELYDKLIEALASKTSTTVRTEEKPHRMSSEVVFTSASTKPTKKYHISTKKPVYTLSKPTKPLTTAETTRSTTATTSRTTITTDTTPRSKTTTTITAPSTNIPTVTTTRTTTTATTSITTLTTATTPRTTSTTTVTTPKTTTTTTTIPRTTTTTTATSPRTTTTTTVTTPRTTKVTAPKRTHITTTSAKTTTRTTTPKTTTTTKATTSRTIPSTASTSRTTTTATTPITTTATTTTTAPTPKTTVTTTATTTRTTPTTVTITRTTPTTVTITRTTPTTVTITRTTPTTVTITRTTPTTVTTSRTTPTSATTSRTTPTSATTSRTTASTATTPRSTTTDTTPRTTATSSMEPQTTTTTKKPRMLTTTPTLPTTTERITTATTQISMSLSTMTAPTSLPTISRTTTISSSNQPDGSTTMLKSTTVPTTTVTEPSVTGAATSESVGITSTVVSLAEITSIIQQAELGFADKTVSPSIVHTESTSMEMESATEPTDQMPPPISDAQTTPYSDISSTTAEPATQSTTITTQQGTTETDCTASTTHKITTRPGTMRTTTSSDFLTEVEPIREPIDIRPVKGDYDLDDIFGPTIATTKPPTTTTHKPVDSDLEIQLFGERDLHDAKVIFANFYEASTDSIKKYDDMTAESEPLTSQSYETSISYQVSKRKVKQTDAKAQRALEIPKKLKYRRYKPSEAVYPSSTTVHTTSVYTESVNTGAYFTDTNPTSTTETKYTTQIPSNASGESKEKNSGTVKHNSTESTREALDDLAMRLVNHARSINFMTRSFKPTRRRYKKRTYSPRSRKTTRKRVSSR